MTLDNVILDPAYVNGVQVDFVPGNVIATTGSGADYAVQKWPYPRRQFTIPYRVVVRTGFQAFVNFYSLRGGTARAFLLQDPSNCYASSQSLGQGDGAKTAFQLLYKVSDSANSFTRNVLHPIPTGTAIPAWLQGAGPGDTSAVMVVKLGEVQSLAITGTPTGGTFTLTFGASTTAAIAYNASAATVQTALAAVGVVAICSGGALPGSAVTIAFVTPGGSQALLTANGAGLTGGTSPAAAVTRTTAGATKTEVTDFTVNTSTGVLTFTAAPAANQVALASFWFYTVARFMEVLKITLDSIYGEYSPVLIEDLYD